MKKAKVIYKTIVFQGKGLHNLTGEYQKFGHDILGPLFDGL
jgi:hypothetical protein